MTVIFEDFEDASLEVTVYSGDWETGASEVGGHGGTDAYRSKTGLGHSATSTAHFTIPSGTTICSFWYRVSSEEYYDVFNAYLNAGIGGQVHIVTDQSGEVDWTHVIVDCTGKSTLNLYYAKDSGFSDGYDAAYIDDLVFADGIGPGWLRHELYLDGAWRDITGDVMNSDLTEISRGKGSESDELAVESCTFTLKDTGDYSPSNPEGQWYGYIGRNTLHRCSIFGSPAFHGEISEWNGTRVKGADVTMVGVTSSSIMRRLTQGKKTQKSAYYRGVTVGEIDISDVVAYWPLEDQSGSTVMSSALSRNRGMTVYGSPNLASDSNSFYCSKPLPILTTGSAFAGPIRAYGDTGEIQLSILLYVPETPVQARLVSLLTEGTASRWELTVETDGDITIAAYGVTGSSLLSSRLNLNGVGNRYIVEMKLDVSGSDTDWKLNCLQPGASSSQQASGTLSSYVTGRATWVAVAPGALLDGVTVGHLLVRNALDTSVNVHYQLLYAYAGFKVPGDTIVSERAGARLQRICGEEGISYASTTSGVRMGPQPPGTVAELLRDTEASDGGLLYSARDDFGLAFTSGEDLSAQAAALTLDYSAGDLDDFTPVQDDRGIHNKIILTRRYGSSYTAELSSGPLSTQDPPDGIGRAEDNPTISIQFDGDLPYQADWRLARSTIDEPRFSELSFSPHRSEFTAADILTALALDIGDLIVVADPPSDYIPDDMRQIVIGRRDTLSSMTWTVGMSTIPEGVYAVPVIGTTRIGPGNTTLWSTLTTTSNFFYVEALDGGSWSHSDGDFDIAIGGEEMTATAVAYFSGNYWSLTVTRSVNGVVKAQAPNQQVTLYRPTYIALPS